MNPPRKSRRRDRLPATAGPIPFHRRRLPLLLWAGRIVVAAVLACGVGFLPYRLYLRTGLSHFVKLRGELTQLEERNRKLRAGIVELRLQLERFQEDSDAIERVARDELGLVRSGEVVFKVE